MQPHREPLDERRSERSWALRQDGAQRNRIRSDGCVCRGSEHLARCECRNRSKHSRRRDYTTARSEQYQYNFDLPDIAELWRRGSVISSWLLDLTASALASDSNLAQFAGRVSDSGEGRWTIKAAIDEGVPFFPRRSMHASPPEAKQATKTDCCLRCATLTAVIWKGPQLPRSLPDPREGAKKHRQDLAALKRELAQVALGNRPGYVRWFTTGKGQYGEDDKFIGVSVPKQRAVATHFRHLELDEIEELLESRIHEYRYVGLLILVGQYETGDAATQQGVFEFYLKHTRYVNNWDLVDTSAPYIVGEHLARRSRRVLYRLAKSSEWWERRIAMIATAAFIDRGDLTDTFAIASQLLSDKHDLIHKAIGWMLREAGDHSRARMIDFLKRNYSRIPRTTLRYAIEHLPQAQRKRMLRGFFA